ncbi:MAG: hypothetical protein ACREMY_07570, partial [bacterium]
VGCGVGETFGESVGDPSCNFVVSRLAALIPPSAGQALIEQAEKEKATLGCRTNFASNTV